MAGKYGEGGFCPYCTQALEERKTCTNPRMGLESTYVTEYGYLMGECVGVYGDMRGQCEECYDVAWNMGEDCPDPDCENSLLYWDNLDKAREKENAGA